MPSAVWDPHHQNYLCQNLSCLAIKVAPIATNVKVLLRILPLKMIVLVKILQVVSEVRQVVAIDALCFVATQVSLNVPLISLIHPNMQFFQKPTHEN